MLVDAHAHLNFKAFKDDWKEVINQSLSQNIWIINIGSQFATSKKAIKIAQQYSEGVYAAVGFHPIHVKGRRIKDGDKSQEGGEFNQEELLSLARGESKVICIGETGLDYYRIEDYQNKNKQAQVFKAHLEVARQLKKPVMLHCRDISVSNSDYPKLEKNIAYKDLLDVLKEFPELKGVIHCFGGNLEIAQQFIDLGYLIGFTGIITFKKKAEDLQEVVRALPLEKIVIETDCPYLTPEPHRSERNEPSYVKYIAKKIAELKKIDLSEVAQQTTQNARELFGI